MDKAASRDGASANKHAMTSAEVQRRYRQVIGHFATGVAIITAHGPDGPSGLTANALCSLALEPLLLLVCVDNTARTLPVIRRSGCFAVNVLDHEQHVLSGLFASKRPEAEKFAETEHHLERGVPVLDGALAWLVCDLREEHSGGDHTIAIGAVIDMHERTAGAPLIWYRGDYGTITGLHPAEARLPN